MKRTSLKRGKRLERRTGLKPGGTLARTRLRDTTPIRKTSAKRRREQRVRTEVVRRLGVERGPACELAVSPECRGRWEHGHERLFRSAGGSIADPDNILLACDPCNQWCSANKAEAVARGFAVWSSSVDRRIRENGRSEERAS